MKINFSAPSKTFLVGEYAVLNGGPALVLCTEPRFSFTASAGAGQVTGISEASPAGLWLKQNQSLWADWDLNFSDPHGGAGGFGASGAQFLFAHALTTLLSATVKRAVEGMDLESILKDFKTVSGGAGSGVDMIAQATGRVARVLQREGDSLAWPYPDLDFAIVRTGQKVATHTHLSEITFESLDGLAAPAVAAVESFGTRSSGDFVVELREFSLGLRSLGLQVCEPLLKEIEREPWCVGAKGCGALGADTILVLFAPSDLSLVKDYFANRQLNCVATSNDLSSALEMNWSHL